jgi:hypothetical protein
MKALVAPHCCLKSAQDTSVKSQAELPQVVVDVLSLQVVPLLIRQWPEEGMFGSEPVWSGRQSLDQLDGTLAVGLKGAGLA